MSKYSKSIYGLLAAVGFYAFFGFFVPEYLLAEPSTNSPGAADAVRSISPVMKVAVLAISLGLVVQSVINFSKARSE